MSEKIPEETRSFMRETRQEKMNKGPVGKVMYQPFMEELPEFVQKLRRNLLVTGAACVVYKASGARLASDGSFLGIKFEHLNAVAIDLSLLAVLIYLMIHFLWVGADQYTKWKLRKSGVKNRVTKLDLDEDGIPQDIQNVTLYSWWAGESSQMALKFECLRQVRRGLIDIRERIQNVVETEQRENSDYVMKKLDTLNGRLGFLNDEQLPHDVDREEISDALKRFDTSFWRYQRSRVLRFFALEFALPVILGGAGIILIAAGLMG